MKKPIYMLTCKTKDINKQKLKLILTFKFNGLL